MQNKNKRVEYIVLKKRKFTLEKKKFILNTLQEIIEYTIEVEKNYDYRKLCEPQFEYVFKKRKT